MAKYDGMKFTAAGRTLLARAIAGEELRFTRVMVGDGVLPDGANIYELSDLIHPVKEVPISSIKVTTVGQATITAVLTNVGQASLLTVREIGIFAADPDEGSDILYSYTNAGDYPDYVPGQDGADIYQSLLSFVTVIDNAQNVTAVIDSQLVFVTREELEDKVSEVKGQIADLFKPPAPIAGFWANANDDGNVLRKATLEEARLALLGLTSIDSLRRAVEVNQDNIGEILLKLELINLYPNYTHMLCEDFKIPDMVDLYSCNVQSVVAGDDSLDCDPVFGMYPGSWYTITDGISYELVQVKSVSIENGVQRVILYEPIQHTYRLKNCRLYRTSATLEEDHVLGPTGEQTKTWSSSAIWQGQDANTEFDIPLAITAGNYQADGDITVTVDGLATLGAE
jgi:hypothetical protein